jgi:hypothetical protein
MFLFSMLFKLSVSLFISLYCTMIAIYKIAANFVYFTCSRKTSRSGIVQACGGGDTHDSVAQAGSRLDTPQAAVDTPNYDPNFRGISVPSSASCLWAKKYSRRHLVSTGVSECRTRRYANSLFII